MLKTFSIGGVHPADHKFSAKGAVEVLAVPDEVAIPLDQHIGVPAKPVVKRGDEVKVGQIIAQSSGFVSSNIHSSVSGTVVKIDKVPDISGFRRDAVIIKTEGDDWEPAIDRSAALISEFALSSEEIIQRISSAGVVGLGGATFPSHVKLTPPIGKKCDILIINGVECEPFLTSDHRLMLEKGQELIVGIRILMKALNVPKAIIGIENNKSDAVEMMKELTADNEDISVEALKVMYPLGGEKQLIDALIGRQVPSGKLPVEVGAIVHNVGTVFAVYEAVQKNKPLIERIVTLTGLNVKHPGNYLVRIGTPVSALIEAAGGLPSDTGKIVAGGPMMVKALSSLDVSITKGTSGILLIPEKVASRQEADYCIRCGKCVAVCPMGLSPYLLMTLSEKEMWERAEEERILDCIECGSCSFICPSYRPILDYIRYGKGKVGQIIRNRKK